MLVTECHFLYQWSGPKCHGELSVARRKESQPRLEEVYSMSKARVVGGRGHKYKENLLCNSYPRTNIEEHKENLKLSLQTTQWQVSLH